MSEQHNPLEDAKGAVVSGVTSPHADLFHDYLVDEFTKSLATDANETYARWGFAFLYSLDDESAQAQLTSLGFEPKDALDFYNLGCAQAHAGDFKTAAVQFAKATDLNPALTEAWFNRALALESAGDKPKARQAWQACLERSTDASEDELKDIKNRIGALADA